MEAGIDPRREALVALDPRALLDHRRGIDVGHHLHRVRVAHRHRGDRHRVGAHRSGCTTASESDTNGTFAGASSGTPMSTVTRPSARRRGAMIPERVSTQISALSVSRLSMKRTKQRAPFAALLDLAAIGVEDAVAKSTSGRAAGSTTSS